MYSQILIDNINILSEQALSSPETIKLEKPISERLKETVFFHRKAVSKIIHKKDKRLLVICGPCSVHDLSSAMEYASRLAELRNKYIQHLYIVMRVYFEKPRTTVGWKGYINDPHIDGTFDLEYGLRKARSLLIDINELGLPIATEALDPITPQYISDLVSWSAIGARTAESQTHRDMASGLSMPVGFKNGTDGNLTVALNGMIAATKPQVFLGMNSQGNVCLLRTKGNSDIHLVLRGGNKPNYEKTDVLAAEQALKELKLPSSILIDCSHGNSNKDHRRQPIVVQEVLNQCSKGSKSIIGIMIESNLFEGNQPSNIPKNEMKYGISITDACISWDTTVDVLSFCNEVMQKAR
jgi:3-deoxy-7-phosphoheptulonate synthase